VAFEGRGNGRSDRPSDPSAYDDGEFISDAVAVLDATDTDRAVVVGVSMGGHWSALLAAHHPSRVTGAVLIGAVTSLVPPAAARSTHPWGQELDTEEGWAKYNRHYWRRDYGDFVEFFFSQVFIEPHSTKQREDAVDWAHETDAETLIATHLSDFIGGTDERKALSSIRCPVLVIHGTDDRVRPYAGAEALAAATGGELLGIEGGGHCPHARDPVLVNLAIRRFVDSVADGDGRKEPKTWTRALDRRRRALYVSSPIGLGHARRDVAIAHELARIDPDLEIDWLAQHPVTTVLEAEGHSIHPASRWLANESAHIASEAAGHDLHCFQALRRMDEILVTNFMVFQEVMEDGAYDLVIADEAWDIDHFWHENPELKRGSHVWMTDFVGFVPMPDGGDGEAFLTADYNAEMVEHIARYPGIRDRALFVGNPDDIVPDLLGPDLPAIRDWTVENFSFSGYVTGFTPPSPDRVAELRDELGYRDDEQLCLVTVGGSGVGRALMERVVEAFPYARKEMADLRMVVVTGPRIAPESVEVPDGVDVVGYVDRLHRHLSVCDLAIVQGGLTTTMELTAARRPFLYFPLRNHFEQNRHVRFRLDRYRAGRYMDFDRSDPEDIAAAMVTEMAKPIDYRPVESDGASRAARFIAELL
jgi:pimeloyl-ACP methyl ester carboxylesterase/predicted glycosyltransferase